MEFDFLFSLLVIISLILAANFCFLLIGRPFWQKGGEFKPIKLGQKSFTSEKFAVGVSTGVIGLGWLVAWFYFMFIQGESFVNHFRSLWFHVLLQLVASVALIVASVAIFLKWPNRKKLFFVAMGTLVASIFIALVTYGPRGHGEPIFMYLIGVWTLVVGVAFTAGVYFFDYLVHEYEDEKSSDRKSLQDKRNA